MPASMLDDFPEPGDAKPSPDLLVRARALWCVRGVTASMRRGHTFAANDLPVDFG